MSDQRSEAAASLLVRGGTLIDGTGTQRRRADVRIGGGVITEVGPELRPDGEPQLDASGAFVTPGFIEGHTHFDPTLYWDPGCDTMPQHGVTTVLFGNCSLSLAPVRDSDRRLVSNTFGVIEEIPEQIFSEHIPWDWESYPEYVSSMRSRRFGVNVAGFVGLSMLRLFVIGDEAWERPSTEAERDSLSRLLDRALEAGASGLSSSYYDFAADGRLVPSGMADEVELGQLLSVTGVRRGHFEVLTAMLDPALSEKQLEMCAQLCRAADVAMTFNGFSDRDRDPSFSENYIALARRLQAQGHRIYPTMSPHPSDFMANFQGGMGFLTVPAWNELLQAGSEAEQGRMLADPTWRVRAAADWDRVPKATFPHHALDRVHIESVEREDLEPLVGQTFGSWAEGHGGHPSDALADWLEMNHLHPGLTYTVGNSKLDRVAALLRDPATIVSASDAGAHCITHCNAGDTTLLLTQYVRDRGDITLEEAVSEITSRLADVYGLGDVGQVEAGRRGDLAVFDLDELTWAKPEAVFDFPGYAKRYRRPPGGFRATVVNGTPSQIEGQSTGSLPGTWLSGKSPAKI